MVYEWKNRVKIPIEAQVAGERIEYLEKKHKGATPKIVLDDARHKGSPLHPAFEWDDDKAAEAFRIAQAGYMLRSIVQIDVEPDQEDDGETVAPIRAFVNVSIEGKNRFVTLARAMSEEDLRKQVVARALDEIEGWSERYREYKELAAMAARAERFASKVRDELFPEN